MTFRKVASVKLADAVIDQIEDLILRGVLRPGDRLPAERELAEEMGVSRPSLRDALAALQDRGLLVARPGAGVFVADVLGSAFSPALVHLISNHDPAIFDYIAFRRDMEGLAAARAARVGSDTDLAVIDAVFQRMSAPGNRPPEEEARLDVEFHMAIIEASHNVVMLHMMRSMFDLLSDGVVYNRNVLFRQRTRRDDLLDQHGQINAAIQARRPDAAKAAMDAHLSFIESALFDDAKARRNEATAQLRLEQVQRS